MRVLNLFFLLCGALVHANHIHIQTYMSPGLEQFWSCYYFYQTLSWEFPDSEFYGVLPATGAWGIYFGPLCNYPPAVGTILLCSNDLGNNSTKIMNKLYNYMDDVCSHYSQGLHDANWYKQVFENATENYEEYYNIKNISAPLSNAITTNMTYIDSYRKGNAAYFFNLDSGTWFSIGIVVFYLLVFAIAGSYNLATYLGVLKDLHQQKWFKWLQSNLILPPLIKNGKFTMPYGSKFWLMSCPKRIEFVVDFFLFVLQVVFYCIPYRQNDGIFTTTTRAAWQRFLADRSGIMAFGKIPILILFAGRINFLIWITGWSHSTFIHFHKVLSRWMFLDACIHSIAYTIQSLGHYASNLEKPYFASGVAATAIGGAIIFESFHYFRRYYYEYFYFFHLLFSIGFIITCWFHCNILGWLEWVIAACCVWFFDRLVRVFKMIHFGYKETKVSLVAPDLLKLEIDGPLPKLWNVHPGSFGYIYFQGILFWENHPLTMIVEDNKLVGYLKVKKGLTFRLYNKCLSQPYVTKACIEGPYGGRNLLNTRVYDEILLIAGGSGITSLIQAATIGTRGKLIWIVKSRDSIEPYVTLLNSVSMDVDIYITEKMEKMDKIDLPETSSKSLLLKLEIEFRLNMFQEKPYLNRLINNEVNHASGNYLSIVSCGPPKLLDDLRNVIVGNIQEWSKPVDYLEEYQSW